MSVCTTHSAVGLRPWRRNGRTFLSMNRFCFPEFPEKGYTDWDRMRRSEYLQAQAIWGYLILSGCLSSPPPPPKKKVCYISVFLLNLSPLTLFLYLQCNSILRVGRTSKFIFVYGPEMPYIDPATGQILGQYLKLIHDRFLPYPSQFIIHCHPTVRNYSVWATVYLV